jgi:serine/threonine protein kinase
MDNGRYIDREYIGSGGMASVYKAFDQKLKRHVAIKEMAEHMRDNAAVRKLFHDEATKMAAIKEHRNVVQVYDSFDREGIPTIVMELLEGGSLASRLGPGAVPVGEVLVILEQVASGLRAIHSVGVVHRDIKPENIIEDHGVYKITDFGVAMSGDEDTLPFVTSKYAAPEVLLEPDKIGAAADLYSLGMITVELLLGPRRFEEVVRKAIETEQSIELPAIQESVQAFWQQWVASSVELPPLNTLNDAIPADLALLIARLVRRDQNARIADCAVLLEELAKLRQRADQNLGAPTKHDPRLADKLEKIRRERERAAAVTPKSGAPSRPRSRALKVVGLAVVLLLVSFSALLFWPTGFRVDVVTEPLGAVVTHNGRRYEGYPTPTWFSSSWGDTFVLELDGHPPVERVLAEGMPGLAQTETGFRLHVAFEGSSVDAGSDPPHVDGESVSPIVIDSSEKAASMIKAWLPQATPPEIALEGVNRSADGAFMVPLGWALNFRGMSERDGMLTVLHLGADDAASLIYPDPRGGSVEVDAGTVFSVGKEIGLVTSEPTGLEWFVFLLSESALNPPSIDGMEPVGNWARRYPFGGAESAGRDLLLWLLGTGDQAELIGAVVPVEIVR